MNLYSKASSEITKTILFVNIEIISINYLYTQNSTNYLCLESLVERLIASALVIDFFILGAKTT